MWIQILAMLRQPLPIIRQIVETTMCTVSFIGTNPGFIITSNRDEKQVRAARRPEVYVRNNKTFIFPADPQSGGTWIAMREDGYAACLLNGAIEKHTPAGNYAKSRGVVLLELLEEEDPAMALNHYSFCGIEPFTLLLAGPEAVELMRWNSREKYFQSVNDPLILSSATLYNQQQRAEREKAFRLFTEKGEPQSSDIFRFHQGSYTPDKANDFLMEREAGLKTLSTTQIIYKPGQLIMKHADYVNAEEVMVGF